MNRLLERSLAVLAWAWRQRPGWRYVPHVLVYFSLMLTVSVFMEPLRQLDWILSHALAQKDKPWPVQVELVDLAWDMDPSGIIQHRARLAETLEQLAALPKPPQIVVVGMALLAWPLDPPAPRPTALQAAVQHLVDRDVLLVASIDTTVFQHVTDYDEGLTRNSSAGIFKGNAIFGHAEVAEVHGSYWYYNCFKPPPKLGHECDLLAIPLIVGAMRADPAHPALTASVDDAAVLVQPGDATRVDGHVWQLSGGRLTAVDGATDPGQLAGKIVIVGSIEKHDQRSTSRLGLLGWAIGDTITPSPQSRPRVLALISGAWGFAFAFIFSALTLLLFGALKNRTRLLHRHLVAVTVGSALLALLALALTVLVLRFALYAAYWQASFVIFGILLTSVLAWLVTRDRLRDQALYTSVADPNGRAEPAFDVFISYSHTPRSNRDWVQQQLVEPLQKLNLRVFFDEKSIHIGTWWYFELASNIERSRCVVPVYSDDYFRKNFCRFELGKAAVRDITNQGKSFRVLPFLRDARIVVPPEFNHLQYELAVDPEQMLRRIIDTLAQIAPGDR